MPVRVDVVAAVIWRDKEILITRRLDHVHLGGLWEFPGGKVEPGESMKPALVREILEELGIEITPNHEIFTVEHDYPAKSVRLHFFHCTLLKGEPKPLEVAELRWVKPGELNNFEFPPADAELIRMLSSGEWPPRATCLE